MLNTNRHGHVVCTQGGEAVAGLKKALAEGLIQRGKRYVVDSTSHQLKFASFQQQYFEDSFAAEYGVTTKAEYKNAPVQLAGQVGTVADYLGLKKRN